MGDYDRTSSVEVAKYKSKWGDVGLVASGLGICAVYSWWIGNWKVCMTLGPLMALFGDDREAGKRLIFAVR